MSGDGLGDISIIAVTGAGVFLKLFASCSGLGEHKDPERGRMVAQQREGVCVSAHGAGGPDPGGGGLLQEEPQRQEAALAPPHVQRHRECSWPAADTAEHSTN